MNFFKKIITLLLFIGCIATSSNSTYAMKHQMTQDERERILTNNYLRENVNFIYSPFFLNCILHIPVSNLRLLIKHPQVKDVFKKLTNNNTRALKRNHVALMKLIVENQEVYEPIVMDFLNNNPQLKYDKNVPIKNWAKVQKKLFELKSTDINIPIFQPIQFASLNFVIDPDTNQIIQTYLVSQLPTIPVFINQQPNNIFFQNDQTEN